MSTETENNLAAQLAALLAANPGPLAASPSPVPGFGWQRPQPAALTAPVGVAVPVSLDTPNGKIRLYLHFDGAAASSPAALNALLEGLSAQGVPLDCWRARTDWRSSRNGWGR